VTYAWTYSAAGATIDGTTNSVMLDLSTSAVSGSLSVVATNSCGPSSPRQLAITVNPLPAVPGPFETFSDKLCKGTSGVQYTVPDDPTVTYEWTYSGTDVTIDGASNAVALNFNASATNGDLKVVAKNGCGVSDSRSVDIIVEQPLAALSFTTSTSKVCVGQQDAVYQVTHIEGASYSWSYTGAGATITSDNSSALVDFDPLATPGQLQTVATNSCGTGTPAVLDITFRSIPGTPDAFTTSTGVICEGARSVPYSIPGKDDVNYSWKYSGTNAGIKGTNSSITIDFNAGATNGALSVVASNVCGKSAERKMDVTVNPTPSKPVIVKESTALIQVLLKVNTDAQQYKWYKDGSVLTSAVSKELDVQESGSYTVKVANNGCESPLSDALNAVFVGLVDEFYAQDIVSVYPNPGANEIEVQFFTVGDQPQNLSILDSKGSKIEEIKTPASGEVRIPVYHYADGIYFVRVTIDSRVVVRKFVKVAR
jgi:hypothetical protein